MDIEAVACVHNLQYRLRVLLLMGGRGEEWEGKEIGRGGRIGRRMSVFFPEPTWQPYMLIFRAVGWAWVNCEVRRGKLRGLVRDGE